MKQIAKILAVGAFSAAAFFTTSCSSVCCGKCQSKAKTECCGTGGACCKGGAAHNHTMGSRSMSK